MDQQQPPQQPQQPQQNPYQPDQPSQNPFPQQQSPMHNSPQTDGFAIASMVLGIIAVLCCYFGAIPGLIAVIFGHLSLSKIKKSPLPIGGKGMAIAGLVTGYVGIAVTIFAVIAFAIAVNSTDGAFSVFREEFEREMKKQQELQQQQLNESDDPFSDEN